MGPKCNQQITYGTKSLSQEEKIDFMSWSSQTRMNIRIDYLPNTLNPPLNFQFISISLNTYYHEKKYIY